MHTSYSHLRCTLLFTPPTHTSYAHLLFTPPTHTSYSHLLFTPHTHTSYSHLLLTPLMHTSDAHLRCTPPTPSLLRAVRLLRVLRLLKLIRIVRASRIVQRWENEMVRIPYYLLLRTCYYSECDNFVVFRPPSPDPGIWALESTRTSSVAALEMRIEERRYCTTYRTD